MRVILNDNVDKTILAALNRMEKYILQVKILFLCTGGLCQRTLSTTHPLKGTGLQKPMVD